MKEETVNKIVDFYIKRHNSLDPMSIESAIKYGIKAGYQLKKLDDNDYITIGNYFLRSNFKSLSEINEYLNKHLI
jgi:hypothetical protein